MADDDDDDDFLPTAKKLKRSFVSPRRILRSGASTREGLKTNLEEASATLTAASTSLSASSRNSSAPSTSVPSESLADTSASSVSSPLSPLLTSRPRRTIKTPPRVVAIDDPDLFDTEDDVASTSPSKRSGFCPFCQVPFSALSAVETSTWHVSLCLSSPSKSVDECPLGTKCDSTIPSHYKKFTHATLARWRDAGGAAVAVDADRLTGAADQADEEKSGEAALPHPDGGCLNAATDSSTSEINLGKKGNKKTGRRKLEDFFGQPIPTPRETDDASALNQTEVSAPTKTKTPGDISGVPSRGSEEREIDEREKATEMKTEVTSTLVGKETRDANSKLEEVVEKLEEEEEEVEFSIGAEMEDVLKERVDENDETVSRTERSTPNRDRTKQISIAAFFPPPRVDATGGGLSSRPEKREAKSEAKGFISQASSEWLKSKKPTFPIATDKSKPTAVAGGKSEKPTAKRGEPNRSRPCPFYKWIPGTSFTVDAFSFGRIPDCSAYFLSHFHADHYKGLNRKFDHGTIVCSRVTANLIKRRLGVSPSLILSAGVDAALDVDGIKVTLIEANHCPGAVLFLFLLKDGRAFLHTGDFRADETMLRHPSLQSFVGPNAIKRLDNVFLDTTYCDPRYDFPPQRDVVEFAVDVAVAAVAARPKTLFVCGSYTIGKERIFKAIASSLSSRVFVRPDKLLVLRCIDDDDELQRLLTSEKDAAAVHVIPMHLLNVRSLAEYLATLRPRFDNVLAFKPTGWTFESERGNSTIRHSSSSSSAVLRRIVPTRSGPVTVYGVPYSEHSSFDELRRFVVATRPKRVTPTVNVGVAEKRDAMQATFREWMRDADC